jgi:hypothetical protein
VYCEACGSSPFDSCAVLDVLPNPVLHLGNAVGHAVAHLVIADGQQVAVAMAAGDAQRRPAHLHVRPGNLACVDGVAQVHIGKAACAQIAHRGNSGQQRGARVHHPIDRLFGVGRSQLAVGIEVCIHGQVRVHIDQAGQHCQAGQIHNCVACQRGCRGRGRDGLEGFAHHHKRLSIEQLSCLYIEQVPGPHQGAMGHRPCRGLARGLCIQLSHANCKKQCNHKRIPLEHLSASMGGIASSV